jgi:hypothetical protein
VPPAKLRLRPCGGKITSIQANSAGAKSRAADLHRYCLESVSMCNSIYRAISWISAQDNEAEMLLIQELKKPPNLQSALSKIIGAIDKVGLLPGIVAILTSAQKSADYTFRYHLRSIDGAIEEKQ